MGKQSFFLGLYRLIILAICLIGHNNSGYEIDSKNLPVAIYHAFDLSFNEIVKKLPEIAKAGYSHIQVSPIQDHRKTLPHTFVLEIKRDFLKKNPDVLKQDSKEYPHYQTDELFLSDSETTKLFRQKIVPRLLSTKEGYLDTTGRLLLKDADGNSLQKQWWLAYQPTGYTINSQYGSQADFENLISEAKKHDIGIIVDIVFNHVAGLDGVERAEWIRSLEQAESGHPAEYDMYMGQLVQVHKDFDKEEYFNPFKINKEPKYSWHPKERKIEVLQDVGDEPGIWMNGALPSLNLDSPHVWEKQKQYLDLLTGLGVKGFRFDLLAFFDPKRHWDKYYKYLQEQNTFAYGELVADRKYYPSFIKYGPVTDHELTKTLEKAFTFPHDDLRILRNPITNEDPNSVTYTNSHDMEEGRVGNKIQDPINRRLATQYLIARKNGVPLILDVDNDKPENTAAFTQALKFRYLMNKCDALIEHIVDTEHVFSHKFDDADSPSRTIMVMIRGNKGFMILNMRNEEIHTKLDFSSIDKNIEAPQGSYSEIQADGTVGAPFILEDTLFTIPARSAIFFVKNR